MINLVPLQVTIEQAIRDAIATVYRDTGRAGVVPSGPMLFGADLGFDSLDMAHCVVLLERSLGINPLRSPAANMYVRTVADLSSIYLAALSVAD